MLAVGQWATQNSTCTGIQPNSFLNSVTGNRQLAVGQWATQLGIANDCWVIGPNTDEDADLVYIS